MQLELMIKHTNLKITLRCLKEEIRDDCLEGYFILPRFFVDVVNNIIHLLFQFLNTKIEIATLIGKFGHTFHACEALHLNFINLLINL